MRRKDRRQAQTPVTKNRRTTDERRAAERVLVDLEVDYKNDETFLFAYITDLSTLGIFIKTLEPLPPGTRLNLRFGPPAVPPIEVEAMVVWVNPHRPGDPDSLNPGMGAQFTGVTAAQRDQLMKLVRTFAYLSDEEESTLGHS